MENLIKAFQIFSKYLEKDSYQWKYPTHCEHDELTVCVDPSVVSQEDIDELMNLGFDKGEEYFYSYHYGSR